MIVEVARENLKANPFRRIEKYPYERGIVDELKKSMRETGVWIGIVARKAQENGNYEIAFGHHRLKAIAELVEEGEPINEIPVDVRELNDMRMVRMMAYENMSARQTTTANALETVDAARKVLEAELKKYKTWEEMCTEKFFSTLIESEKAFRKIKGNKYKVGREILEEFLGMNWTGHIQMALSVLNDKEIDDEAVEMFNKPYHAKVFTEQVRKKHIDKEDQKQIARDIITEVESEVLPREKEEGEKGELTGEKIKNKMAAHFPSGNELVIQPERRDINDALRNFIWELRQINVGIEDILDHWDDIRPDLQEDYAIAAEQFAEIHKNFREKNKSCKRLLGIE